MFAPRRILVPTDFSEFSDKALKLACDIAEQNKAKIYLLHVVGVVQRFAVDYSLDQQTIDNLEVRSIAFSKDMMNKQIKKTIRSEDVEIISEVRKGSLPKRY